MSSRSDSETVELRPTVLVVDDSPESLRLISRTLEDQDIKALVAIDGQAALDLLAHIMPDLVLMDAVMPGMDGFETTRRLKADPRFRHLPVIFITGLSETEHVLQGFEAGGVDYVHKPIVIDELLARVRAHLANARVALSSQLALDTAGRPSFGVDGTGRLLWFTPLVSKTLDRLFPSWREDQQQLPPALAASLAQLQASKPASGIQASIDVADSRLTLALLRRTEADEWLFRLTEQREGDEERLLVERHGLTSREAEVLLWISRGKKNREVSEILGISPRTVNKHLEQVFEKLGVETRASATAIAVGTLNR